MALPEMQHAADSKHCRRCGAAYIYDVVYLGHLGQYHCASCGRSRPEAGDCGGGRGRADGTRSARFELRDTRGKRRVRLPLPGLYNVYNALAAAACASSSGYRSPRWPPGWST